MKNNKNESPVMSLREDLRLQASEISRRLSRSVGRLTSCELLPCLEYGEEIEYQQQLVERLLYLQYCREALEKCIHAGAAMQRYRWRDGHVTVTRFRMVGPARVRVSGLLPA
jgi:hypothetical protein